MRHFNVFPCIYLALHTLLHSHFSIMSSRRASVDNTTTNSDQPRPRPPAPPNASNPRPADPQHRRRSPRFQIPQELPPSHPTTPTRRSPRTPSVSAEISPATAHSPTHPPSPPPTSHTAPSQPIIPIDNQTTNSPSDGRLSTSSHTNSRSKATIKHRNSDVPPPFQEAPISFADAFGKRPYPHLHPIISRNYSLNSAASPYITELSEPLTFYPLPTPDYSTRDFRSAPTDHLRPSYSTAEALAYLTSFWVPDPVTPADLTPPLPPHQILHTLSLTDAQQSSTPTTPTLTLLPFTVRPRDDPHPLPPLPSYFTFLQPTPRLNYLAYALYPSIFTNNPDLPINAYSEFRPLLATHRLKPPYPYYIPLLHSLDPRFGPFPFAYYLTPFFILHFLAAIPDTDYHEQNPQVAHYIRLYLLPLRLFCDYYTFFLDPLLTLFTLSTHHPSIPYLSYKQFCSLCPPPLTSPLPSVLIQLNQLASSLPLPPQIAHLPPRHFSRYYNKLSYPPDRPLSNPRPLPAFTMANPPNPSTNPQQTTNLYDSSRSNPLDPPTHLSEPISLPSQLFSRTHQVNLHQLFETPPTVNFTQEDIDNFCRINPNSLSRAQVETFVAQLDDLYVNTTPNTDTLPEARALRSLQRHLHHSTLAAHVQNLLNPNANLPCPKHLYWRQVALQYVHDCNHPPPQRHNLASAIHQMTQCMSRLTQQPFNRPRPMFNNQFSNRPSFARPFQQAYPQRPYSRQFRPPFNPNRPFRPRYSAPRPQFGNRPPLPPAYNSQGHTAIQNANIHLW